MEGPRRYRWYKCVFSLYSMVLEVPELVNFHSILRPCGTKHTHEHTPSLSAPPRPLAGILWSHKCVHLFAFIHLYIHYTNMTHYLPPFTPSSCWFWHYTQNWNVLFFFSPVPFSVLSTLSYPPILSLPFCMATNPPTHTTNMLAYKHRF